MASDYCTLPADDERSIRPFELAPMGSRRFTKSPGDFIHRGIITLSRDCVVSAPLPRLSPCCSDSPPSHGEGTFLSRPAMNADLPSAIRLLLATGIYAVACTKAFALRHPDAGKKRGGVRVSLGKDHRGGRAIRERGIGHARITRVAAQHHSCLPSVRDEEHKNGYAVQEMRCRPDCCKTVNRFRTGSTANAADPSAILLRAASPDQAR
jgi:hypothetical protein